VWEVTASKVDCAWLFWAMQGLLAFLGKGAIQGAIMTREERNSAFEMDSE